MNQKATATIGALVMGAICFLVAFIIWTNVEKAFAAAFPDQRIVGQNIASSTSKALAYGATATRVVSTSTTPGTRIALTFQTINCVPNAAVYLEFNDRAAATTTSYLLAASSTVTFADSVPLMQGSITAFAAYGGCTLNYTEMRLPQ